MDTLDPKSKRKNENKHKGLPRRNLLIGALALTLFAIIGIVLQRRFTPMLDLPTADLVYSDTMKIYALDFQTGQRLRTSVMNFTIEGLGSKEPSPDDQWEIRFEWPFKDASSLLVLEDLTGQKPLRTLGKFGEFHESLYRLSWSSDQQWVVFAANPPRTEASISMTDALETSEIWTVHIPTGEVNRLTSNGHRDSNPIFSPDGTQMAYISSPSSTPGIYLMDVATGESRQVTTDHHVINFQWSPDSQWIAYDGFPVDNSIPDNGDYRYVYIIRSDGTHMKAVTSGIKNILLNWMP